jgi:predicted AlkP superfamily phosphohydrolase/phosphomutase
MTKLVIWGLDGLDPFLLEKWRVFLPNFSSLYDDSKEIVLESTIPPDSLCAWPTIFTGLNPAEHGYLELNDYLNSKECKDFNNSTFTQLKGKTFWDIAGEKGKKVCIVNPFSAYPSWPVNGVMVSGPVFEGGNFSAYPRKVTDNYNLSSLGGNTDFPDKSDLDQFILRTRKSALELGDLSIRMYTDFNPDLFFATDLTLDRIKHFLWRYTDENDPTYPGINPYQDSIKEFYMLFDDLLGKLKDSLSKDTTLLIVSDHGHRRRCPTFLNLNEILRIKGYISVNTKGIRGIAKQIIQRIKVFALMSLSRYDMQDAIYKIGRLIPNRKALKKSSYLIDRFNTAVSLSCICGSSPFGGIDINIQDKAELLKVRGNLITSLKNLNKEIGRDVIKWVESRENVYQGHFEYKLPEIFFELNEDISIGQDFFVPYLTLDYTHKKKSGGHKREGVILLSGENANINRIQRPTSVINIKDFILKILDSK